MKKLSTLFILMAMALAAFADPDSFTVSVSGGNVFTISRSDASAASWVEYYTQSGSAVAGIHYEDVAGRLDFAAGEYSKIVTVPLYSVASIDKFNLESGISRLFYFCIHNNSMANTPRATGWWDDATVISASDISVTSQQTICPAGSYGTWDDGLYFHVRTKTERVCSNAIGDAFTDSQKLYYTLTDQTAKYDFNLQCTYYLRGQSYDQDQAIGVTLDGKSSELAVESIVGYRHYENCSPVGLNQNLVNAYFYHRKDYSWYLTYVIPSKSKPDAQGHSDWNSAPSYVVNPSYTSNVTDGWIVDIDPTKHIGFIMLADYANISEPVVANIKMYDNAAPVITGISANVNRIYTSGERLYVAVHFNEPVTGNVSGASVSIGSRAFSFNYACGLNTNTLVFYSDLTTTAASGITGTVKVTGINGTVTDACGNTASVSSISANNSVPNFRMYPTYAVSLNPNGGTIIDGNFGRYTYSVGATLPTNIEKTGHNFEGWFASESLTGSPVAEIYPTDMGNKTFYAKWSPKNFKVTLVGNGAELSSDIDVTTHVYGTALQLPVLEKPGYTFYGWYPNAELTGDPVYSIGATDMGDKTFYAKWTTNTYYIAYNPAGADGSEPMPNSACTYDAESPLAANTYTRTGYEFLGWATAAQASSITYTDGQSVKNLTDVNSEVVELFAVWKPNTYTVTFSQGEPTTLGTASIEATYDAPLQVVICPDSVGYAFGGYFTEENGGGVQYYTYEGKSAVARYKNTSDITLYAFWTVRDYVISFNNNGGTITTDDYATSYHYGTEVTLPAIKKDGCTFGGWFANVNCTGTAVTKIASSEYGDKTFYAKWNPITYGITLHENGGTIITGNVANYTFGVGAVLPSYSNMERDGHMFAGWYDNELCEGDAVSMVSVAEFGNKEFWAKWEENGYFVTLHTNGGTINSGNVVLYKYGRRTELPSNVTKTGYDFAGWYDNASCEGAAVTEIKAADLGDKQFWARWKEKDYPITFHTNGGTINNVVVDSYTYTVGVVLPADVTQRGYLFRGWYDNEQRTGNPVTLISTTEFGEREFWADWSVVDYDITLNYNGGTIGDDDVPATYRIGSEITLPVPTREGYTFGGWYTNSAYVGEAVQAISSTEIGNKEFWAKWNVNSYTVTLEANGGTINSGNVANYTYGYGIPLPSDVTKTGYTFDGWYADKDCATARVTRISESKTGNLTFYANWNVNSYIVTLETNGGVINSGNVERYTYGKGATLPTNITRDGYTFGGWYTNSSYLGSAVQSISSNEIGDKAFYANWLVNSYSITFEPNGGTINNGNVKNYIYGTTVILPSDVTKTGFTFDGWYDNAEFEGERVAMISSVELGNKAFYANWIVNTYKVTLVTNEGTIAEGQNIERYEYGKGATLPTDVTKEGYTFAGWYSNSSYIGSTILSILSSETGDKTFYAKWTINEYKVSVDYSKIMGTVIGEGYVEYKSTATLKAVANEGYEFIGWNNGELKDERIQLTVTKDTTLVANFKEKEKVQISGVLEIPTLKTEREAAPIDLTDLFVTTEGSEISYSAASSAPNVVAATVSDGKLFLTVYEYEGSAEITVTATLPNGEKNTVKATATVVLACNIQVEETITNVSCYGESDGEIALKVTNAAEPYTTKWENETSVEDTIRNIVAGNYSVVITDNENCVYNKTFTVSQPEEMKMSAKIKNPTCSNADGAISITLTGAENASFAWSNEATTQNVANLAEGDYYVVITNTETGCQISDNYTLVEPEAPVVTISNVISTACNEKSGAVIISGDDNLIYHWNNGRSSKNLVNVSAGDYTLVVTDENNCTATLDVTVPSISLKQPEIALVTVSEQTGKNLVVWLKENTDLIDFYTIYRESERKDVFEEIAQVKYSELSVYEDEEADPNIQPWRYKISATDVCGEETEMSEHHTTMHIAKVAGADTEENKNQTNLIWNAYEGIDYESFIVMCKHKENGKILVDTLATLSANFTSYTVDTAINNVISYYVGVKLPEVVNPKTQFLKAESGPFVLAISNIAEVETVEDVAIRTIAESNANVYSVGHTIYVNNPDCLEITVYDINGRKLVNAQKQDNFSVSVKLDGVYVVTVGKQIVKIIVE